MTRKRRRTVKVLDTSVLIVHWRSKQHAASARRPETPTVRQWAEELIELEGTRFIVTPVRLEFLAGVRSGSELALARIYLEPFEILDEGRISTFVWTAAIRLAERVPRDGKPRHLGDCLIRAIADAHHCDVVTRDVSFPR